VEIKITLYIMWQKQSMLLCDSSMMKVDDVMFTYCTSSLRVNSQVNYTSL
jgi:hypothetical protein